MVKRIIDDDEDEEEVKPVKRNNDKKRKSYIDESDDESVQSIRSEDEVVENPKKKKTTPTPKKQPVHQSSSSSKPAKITTTNNNNTNATPTTSKNSNNIEEVKEDDNNNDKKSSSMNSSSNPATTTAITTTTTKVLSIEELTKGGTLATEQAVKKVLLPYMKRENRPFNTIQLHENFYKRMPKSVLEKALETLSDGNGIRCKEYGKSKIYFADQSTIPCGSDKEIKDLNVDIEKLKRNLDGVSQELTNLKSELNILESEPTDHNLDTALSTLEASVSEKKLRVSQISESKLEPNALNNAIKEHNYFRAIWKQRKEICNDVIDQMMDGTKKKKVDFTSDIGIDTDEDMKVQLPGVIAEIKK